MTELIPPAVANQPQEACALVCEALSDGDLDAAMSYYQPAAVIAPPNGPPVRGERAIRELLQQAAATRMLYEVQPEQTLLVEDTALVTGRWAVLGPDTTTDGHPVGAGRFCTVLRRQPDSSWQIVAEQMTALDHTPDPEGTTHVAPQ